MVKKRLEKVIKIEMVEDAFQKLSKDNKFPFRNKEKSAGLPCNI